VIWPQARSWGINDCGAEILVVEKLRYRDLPYTNAFPLPTNVRGAARESKFQETDSRAYLGSKTVQPMGGSSDNVGAKPHKGSADAGYFSEANLTDERLKGIDLYVACERYKHREAILEPGRAPGVEMTVMEQMRCKLKTVEGRAVYRIRKAIVEPVFGQI